MKIQEHICTVNSRTASTVNVFVQRKLQTGVRRNGSNVPQKKKTVPVEVKNTLQGWNVTNYSSILSSDS